MSLMPFISALIANIARKPVTRPFPAVVRPPFERTRGSIAITIGDCIYCGLCSRKCPTAAIEVSRGESWWQINRLRCIQCGACVECCPKKCLHMANAQPVPSVDGQLERFAIAKPEAPHA